MKERNFWKLLYHATELWWFLAMFNNCYLLAKTEKNVIGELGSRINVE
jgi:hypothetical protein